MSVYSVVESLRDDNVVVKVYLCDSPRTVVLVNTTPVKVFGVIDTNHLETQLQKLNRDFTVKRVYQTTYLTDYGEYTRSNNPIEVTYEIGRC